MDLNAAAGQGRLDPASSSITEAFLQHDAPGNIAVLIDDLHGHLQHEFVRRGFSVVTYFSKRLISTTSAEKFLVSLRKAKPILLWISLTGTPTDTGTQKDRHRCWNLVRFAQEQLNIGAVTVSGTARCNAWELPSLQQLTLDKRLHSTLHRWCRMQVKDPVTLLPSPTTSRLLCSFPVEEVNTCQCPSHAGSTRVGYGRVDYDVVCRYLADSIFKGLKLGAISSYLQLRP